MEQHSAYVPGSWLAFQNLSTNALALDQQEAVREASDPSGVGCLLTMLVSLCA